MVLALENLAPAEALDLLSRASIGRVGVTIGALPAILPVHFAMLDDRIVFRTAPGTKLTAAVQEAVVAFEVDETDVRNGSTVGWSVLVIGRAKRISDSALLERARALDLPAWAPCERDHFVQITVEMVTGRRLRPSTVDHAD